MVNLQVAGAGESLYESIEVGPKTASAMSSLSGLAALAQTTSCNYIYPVLISKHALPPLPRRIKNLFPSVQLHIVAK